jgi:DNA transformation protein
MGVTPGFIEFLKDQLADLGPVTVRRMFGGAGIYHDGVMFALVAEETLYFKADELTKADFEAEGLGPFVYAGRNGANIVMSYWRAPERCLDDPQEMVEWARTGMESALRARKLSSLDSISLSPKKRGKQALI